jgi:hypothetical protein
MRGGETAGICTLLGLQFGQTKNDGLVYAKRPTQRGKISLISLSSGLEMTRRIDALLDEVRNSETLLQNARNIHIVLFLINNKFAFLCYTSERIHFM